MSDITPPLAPFSFIKSAEPLSEDHELFNPEVEETIAKLGFPYAMAMAYRVSLAPISEERKQYYIEEIKEKQKSILQEQEELQRRFYQVCNDLEAKEKYELELKEAQEKNNVILPDESANQFCS
jgi:hypothetical protein